ncbi:MAG: class I SAM-dependent methyltransferase, partial [Acidobacteria bacterium]|nr:class I SAM-dependent methyltransferase [Acidobacteriota bacterium]
PEGSKVQSMFSGIAGRYDLLNHVLSGGVDFYWWWRMAKASGAKPGLRFLDVAAGTGDSSLALAKRGAEVVSTDFTHAMLRLGPAKFAKKRLDRLIFASADADAQKLPFVDACFDGLTICYGIRNVERREAAYAEFLRVLKPGGKLTILEFSTPVVPGLRALYTWYSLKVLPRIGGWLSGDRSAYDYLPESIRMFPKQQDLAAELEAAGFRQVKWTNLTGGIVALHTGVKTDISTEEMMRAISDQSPFPLVWEEVPAKEERVFKTILPSFGETVEMFLSADQIDVVQDRKTLFVCEISDCPEGSKTGLVACCVEWLKRFRETSTELFR